MAKRFTLYVVLAMLLGIAAGTVCHAAITDAATLQALGGYFSIATDASLRCSSKNCSPRICSRSSNGSPRSPEGRRISGPA